MTVQEFHKILEEKEYSYTYENNITTVTHNDYIYLNSLKKLPNNVTFNNNGGVYLNSLEVLPDNIVFNNVGSINLISLKVLPDNVIFNNKGYVHLDSLNELPDNIIFNNDSHIYLNSLTVLPDNVIFNNSYVYLYSLKYFNEDFKNINKIIINGKRVYVIIAEFDKLIEYLYDGYNIDYINKINNRYYVHTK